MDTTTSPPEMVKPLRHGMPTDSTKNIIMLTACQSGVTGAASQCNPASRDPHFGSVIADQTTVNRTHKPLQAQPAFKSGDVIHPGDNRDISGAINTVKKPRMADANPDKGEEAIYPRHTATPNPVNDPLHARLGPTMAATTEHYKCHTDNHQSLTRVPGTFVPLATSSPAGGRDVTRFWPAQADPRGDYDSVMRATSGGGMPEPASSPPPTRHLPPDTTLAEPVEAVLDWEVQASLWTDKPCGPTPQQYRHTLNDMWPLTSGEAWKQFSEYKDLYDKVRALGLPNFLGARIPVPTAFALPEWTALLKDYPDPSLIQMLTYGFPANYSAEHPPAPTFSNHKESIPQRSHLLAYIEKEISHGALLGPFPLPPFSPWSQCSPIMTRPKSTPNERRIIVDLSFPKGRSVNSGIPRNEYLGRPCRYTLPSISDLGDIARQHGTSAVFWAADVARCYRQIRACPLSVPLFGITMDDMLYVDISLPFGCRTSGAACVRVTDAIGWAMSREGYNIKVYVDDFVGCEPTARRAHLAFHRFTEICKLLNVQLSINKCQPPVPDLVWLGFHISAPEMTITIPPAKLECILTECAEWLKRPSASKKALQKLIGKLVHITKCVLPGRRFIWRILATLKRAHTRGAAEVDPEMIKDVKWFISFATGWNGVVLLPPKATTTLVIECDSCLTGGGAYSSSHYFAHEYTSEFRSDYPSIHHLEAVNLIAALTHLGPCPGKGATVLINTDNAASAASLETGRGRDPILGACARQLWLLAARGGFTVEVRHKAGHLLLLADALSRAHSSPHMDHIAQEECSRLGLTEITVCHGKDLFDPNL